MIQPAECPLNFSSNSSEQTYNLGKQIASALSRGSVLTLDGALGSGKTCLAKGIAFALGFTDNLTSPTYTIINEYEKDDITLYHIDAYRLNSDKEFEEIDGNNILNSDGICIIEWSCNIKNSIPQDAITVTINITGNESREIIIKGLDFL
ncbi:MAG: tRNA (adenosine(37)-N6)-threonylcarbamoyltransferase complex ATPase subunit type 1 TsaE [Treponema sp.]|nr:tRNA (adenosine(37)-N6)-threonylcarbamoyltransferase complex ATPase subunit type 1 TsaE [Treponema sp.]